MPVEASKPGKEYSRGPLSAGWDWDQLRADCRREAASVLRDRDEIEDAVQEALVRAWRQRHSCRSADQPRAWMRQIARNEALRLAGRRRQQLSLDASPELMPEGDGDRTDAVALRLSVQGAIGALTPQDRLIALLRYSEDLAQPRIANLLGMPEGTVKVRLHRIRHRLRPALADTA